MGLTRIRADQISDIDYKQAVRVLTISNVILSGGAPSQVDGVNLNFDDRILVAGQSTASQNGIYYVATLGSGVNGTWLRTSDANATGEIDAGMIVMVTEGDTYADTSWKLITNNPITVGTTGLIFAQNTGDSFGVINANGTPVVANTVTSTAIFSSGNNLVLTGNATSDTITFAVTDTPSFVGNVTAPYFIGNGSQLTGITSTYGNANVAAYLPTYTGNLTAGNISATGNITGNSLQFNNSVTPITANVGQAFWDTGEHTVTLGMENGVQQQIGLENYMYVKASAAITNGQAVMFTGANGTNILAAPANTASVGFKSEYIIGVATQDIANNDFGYITVFGLVHGLNTNAWNVGDILWVDNTTPGALTNVQPTDPNYQIQMAAVTKKAGGDGHIQVRVTPFYQLDRLRNVQTTSPTTGQALVYDGANSIWINGTPATANTAATVTTNAQPNITSVGTLSSLSVTGNITGNFFIGNGSQLTGLPAGYANANAVAYGEAGWAGNIIPSANNVYSLGSPTAQWASVYVGNATLYLGDTSISANNTSNTLLVNGNTVVTTLSAGNITTLGYVSATGNITGSYIIGNGSQLTGLPAQYGNANVADYLPTYTGNLTAGNISVTGSISTANITMSGDLIVGTGPTLTIDPNGSGGTDGNVVITGNLTVQGTTTTINSNTISTNDLQINMANNAANATAANNGGIEVGPVGSPYATLLYNTASNVWVASLGISSLGNISTVQNVSAGNILTAGVVSATGNITGGNLSVAGNVNTTGINMAASGSTINVGGVGGTIKVGNPFSSNGTIYVYSGAGFADIIIDGSNSSISADGNITGGNLISNGAVNTSGTISASGNVTGGNILTAGLISATGNVSGNYFIGNGSALTGITVSGSLSWTTQANTAPSGVNPGSFWYDSYSGVKYQYTNDGTGNVWVDQSFPTSFTTLAVTGNATIGGNLGVSGTLTANTISYGNISSPGYVSAVGNVYGSTLNIGNIVSTNANGVGNIGSSSNYFNRIFATATTALYADLAEMYSADQDYVPGTVVEFGGIEEIRASQTTHSTSVAGIISTNPSYLMNAAQPGEYALPVALTGRVPCRVVGKIVKGDRLVASDIPGVATVLDIAKYAPSCIIGKALENYDSTDVGVIEVAVGRT